MFHISTAELDLVRGVLFDEEISDDEMGVIQAGDTPRRNPMIKQTRNLVKYGIESNTSKKKHFSIIT